VFNETRIKRMKYRLIKPPDQAGKSAKKPYQFAHARYTSAFVT